MSNENEGWFSRERALALVLAALTCLAFYLCYRLTVPFLPALAWSAALAIVAHPLHRWLEKKLSRPNLAAGLSVAIVAVLLMVPTIFVVSKILGQLPASLFDLQSRVSAAAARSPALRPIAEFFE